MNKLDYFKILVLNYYRKNIEGGEKLTMDNVFVVWSCKTLQNYKALIATSANDMLFFELTYNGDKKETYIDVYDKKENIVVSD
jgi:hypothetical protein